MLRSSTPAAVFTAVFAVVLAVLAVLDGLFFPESKIVHLKNSCGETRILNVRYKGNLAQQQRSAKLSKHTESRFQNAFTE